MGDFRLLGMAIFVGENRLFVLFVFQSIVPVLQRLVVAVEGFPDLDSMNQFSITTHSCSFL